MKKNLLLSFLYFSIHLQAQSNWELLSPKPSFRTGIDIHFVTSDVGYILNQSEILETNNSGLTWTKKQDITNGVDMDFGNSVGYIVGNNGYVLKTINAGQSWSQITTGSAVNFNSVTVVDTDNIILSSANKLVKSSDGGMTWQTHTIPNNYVNKTTFVNALTGFAACGEGTMLKTIDGGLTWTPKITTNISPAGYFTIYFINETVGFATHEFDDMLKTIDGGETWTPVSGSFQAVYSFCFVNNQVGYACGEYGTLYKTTNAGNTWTQQSFQNGFIGYSSIYGIYFTSEQIGFATGERGRIIKTIDGGSTWSPYFNNYNTISKMAFPTINAGYALVGNSFFKSDNLGDTWTEIGPLQQNANTTDFKFINETTGFAIGGGQVGTSADKKNIYKTTNAGLNWTLLNSVSATFHDSFYCIDFIDENNGFVSGGYNQPGTWKTVNGGNSWQQLNTLRFGQMQFFNSLTGYARNIGSSTTRIYKTIDGGITWNITFEINDDINSFHFINENVGYFVGDGGMMYKTVDGALSWQQLTIPYAYYKLVKFYSQDLGYICDDYNNISRTTDGGTNWVSLPTLSIFGTTDIVFRASQIYIAGTYGKILRSNLDALASESFLLNEDNIKIYPNPIVDKFIVSCPADDKIVSVDITDMLARQISHYENHKIENDLEIDFSNKSKGVYLVLIKTQSNKIETRKLIVK